MSPCLGLVLALAPFGQDPADGSVGSVAPVDAGELRLVFGNLRFEEIEGAEPFRLVHHVPVRDAPAQRVQVEALFAPWLAGLGAHLDEHLWPALGGPATEGFAVVVASHSGSFRSVQRTLTVTIPGGARCVWHPRLDALVTYHDARERTAPTTARRTLLRDAALHLLLERCADPEPVGLWALEGLAGAIAEHAPGDGPGDLGGGAVPAGALRTLSKTLQDETRSEAYLLPLAQLADTAGAESRHLALSRTALEAGRAPPEEDGADRLVLAQAELWVHYLAFRPRAAHREGLLRYVRGVLGGSGNATALRQALEVELQGLDEPFREWAAALAKTHAEGPEGEPERPIAETVLPPASPLPPIATEPEPPPVPPPGPRAWPLEGARHPALILPANDLDAQLASALVRAAEGELDAALEFLARVQEQAEAPDAVRLADERARIEAFRELRDGFLARLTGTPTRLRLVEPGGLLVTTVESLEAGVAHLGRNRSDRDSVAVDSIGAADLLASLGRNADRDAPPWLVAYLRLLAGEEERERDLEGDGEGITALRERGEDLRRLLGEGALHRELALLATEPLPEEAGALRALLDRTGELVTVLWKEDEHGPARSALRALAREGVEALYELRGPRLALRGDLELLDGDRVRLRYDFVDPAQVEDFLDARGLVPFHLRFQPADPAPVCLVDGGALLLRGVVTRRLRLGVRQPTVRYELQFTNSGTEKLGQFFFLVTGLDAEGKRYARALNGLDLLWIGPGEVKEDRSEDRATVVDAPVELKLTHHEDGGLSLAGDGRTAHVEGAVLEGTAIALQVFASYPIRLRSFEVEGIVTEADWTRLRAEWIVDELARLGHTAAPRAEDE